MNSQLMNAKKRALVFASRIGLDQELIELYDELIGVPWGEFPVDEELHRYELGEDERKGDILFTLIPAYDSLCYRFGVLAHAFRTRGYRPVFLYDDGDLPTPPQFTVNDRGQLKVIQSRYRSRRFFETFGFESVAIGEFADHGDYDRLVRNGSDEVWYRNVQLSGCAKASTRKYLKRYSLNLSDREMRDQYENFLRGAAMLVDASKATFDEYDISATVVNESSYIQGFVPLTVSSHVGVPTYSDGWGYRAGHLIFGSAANRNHMGQFAAREVVETALNSELTAEENNEVNAVIDQWRNNEIASIDYANRTGESVDVRADTLVGLFTNLLWDGALEPDQALYDNVYDWLQETIDIIGEQTDTHMVIKPHPAEHLRGTNESVGDWVRSTYDSLPENVTLLASDTEIDTYELFTDLDIGLVYASTVGLEMVCDGLPVVTAGYPPYHGFDITYDPDTKSEYQEFVKRAGEHECSSVRKARARRYFHFLFFCKHFEFPYHSGADATEEESETTTIRHDELTPGNEPWDSIVQQILNGEEVIQPNCRHLKQ